MSHLRKGIAFAGTIAVDEIKKISKYPNRSELTVIKSVSRSNGGAVTNCGISMAKIDPNIPIEVIALVGNDDRGRYLKEVLSRYPNINQSQLKVLGDTPFTDVYQEEEGNTRTFFTYKGNMSLFNENTIDFKKVRSSILHIAYILLLDSLDQEDCKYGTKMARVLKEAQDLGIKTSVDIVSENSNRYRKLVPPSLKYTNYCVINELEAGASVGINLRDDLGQLINNSLKSVLKKLKDYGVKEWVVIHSPEGSFGFDGHEFFSIPSLLLEHGKIKGTVGAGDAYVTGILYGALQNFSLPDAMKLGTAAAASSLLAEDSTSGVQTYRELINMYHELPKQAEIKI